MWSGFDPDLRRQFNSIRQLVRLRHQTPTREWPLVVSHHALLVVREWPDGSVTAYLTFGHTDPPGGPGAPGI
jgi:hypothetical protein